MMPPPAPPAASPPWGTPRSYCWTARGTLLFPALRDKGDKAAAERGERRTVYYEIDPSGGEAVKAFTLPSPP